MLSKLVRRVAAVLAFCAATQFAPAQIDARDLIAINDFQTMVVIDGTSGVVESTLTFPFNVYDAAVTPDGATAIVTAASGSPFVQFVDLTTNPPTLSGTVALPPPFSIDIQVSCTSTGIAVVAPYNFFQGPTTQLAAIDVTTRTLVSTLSIPNDAYTSALSADGSVALLAGWNTQQLLSVAVSSLGQLTLASQTTLASTPWSVAIAPDGTRALVGGGALESFSLSGTSLSSEGTIPSAGGLAAAWVVFGPDSNRAFVTDTGNRVEAFQKGAGGLLESTGLIATVPDFATPYVSYNQIGIAGDGNTVGFHTRSRVNLLDAQTMALIASIPAGGSGGAIAGLCSGGVQAERLSFGTRPSSTVVQNAIWNAFTVRVEDSNGDLIEDATDPVTISRFSGTGILGGTLSKVPTGGIATFDDVTYDTAETMTLLATSPDLSALGAVVVVTPANSDLRILSSDVSFTPSGMKVEVGESTLIQARVRNVGSARADASVAFWLRDPDIAAANAQLLGTAGGSVPLGGSATFGVNWTPSTEGLQSIFVVVDNTTPGGADSTPADNRTSRQVSVGAAEQELQVTAGERTAWPGASTSVPITITNIGFGPATITGVSFGPPSWLTLQTPLVGTELQPGQSLLALVQLDVPFGTPGGPLNGTPEVQPVPIALDTVSGTFADNLVVKVFDQAATNVTIRVVDDATSAPLANALVAAQELPGSFVTGAPSGEVTLQLPPGPNGLFAFRTGYIARAGTFDIPAGSSTVEIRLTAGATLSVDQVVSEPLSTQEIIDRGVDVSDPVNNAVFDFVVSMKIGPPITLRNVEIPKNPQPGDTVSFSGVGSPTGGGGGGGGGGGTLVAGTFHYYSPGGGLPLARAETWIIIPGEVWVLKQFFEVKTFVFNNAQAPNPEDVQLRNVSANLNLPGGLALPDLDGAPQQTTQSLPDLDAQEGAEATWIIRGDLPGTFELNGLVTSDLFAFGNLQTTLSALATSEPFDVTLPRIRCEFFTPGAVQTGTPFTFGVLVTNEASVTAQLVRVILKEENLVNCTLAGTDALQDPQVAFARDPVTNAILSATYTIGDIDPGKSSLANFKLISEVTGIVEQVKIQNGCGAAPSPNVMVTPQPPTIVDQPDPVTACAGAVASFSVTAEGLAPITYQWRKDGVDLPGATGTTLIIQPVATGDAGSYDVVVTNPGGETISNTAILTVQVPPMILTQPVGQTICQGEVNEVSFVVIASGDPSPTFQWRKDGVVIAGATGSSYTIVDPTTVDAGSYDVVVSNPCGDVPSDPAVLTVNVAPAIQTGLADQTVCQDDVTEVVFAVVASGLPEPTYQWSKDGDELPGETGASLTIANPTPARDGVYKVVVTNDCGTAESSAQLTVQVAPSIVVGISDVMHTEGEAVTFTVEADGVPAPTLQWQKDGEDITGQTGPSLTIDPVSYADGGIYGLVATNPCGTAETTATLTVNRIPTITCNAPFELWSPNHELVDVSSVFSVADLDGDPVSLQIRCFSDESEVPETGDGTGKHAPDFKNELGGRGLLLRSERRGGEDGRWYVLVITANDGRGGVLTHTCGVAACPHDQSADSMGEVMAQLAAATAQIQAALDTVGPAALPLAGHQEHGLSGELGPKQ